MRLLGRWSMAKDTMVGLDHFVRRWKDGRRDLTFLGRTKAGEEAEVGVQVRVLGRGDIVILMTARVEKVIGLLDDVVLTVRHALHLQRPLGRMGTQGPVRGGHTRGLLDVHQVQNVRRITLETVDLHRAYHQDRLSLLFPLRLFSNHSTQISHRHLCPSSTAKIHNLEYGLLPLSHPYRTSINKVNNNTVLGLHRPLRQEIHHWWIFNSSKETINNHLLGQVVGNKGTGEATTATGMDLEEEGTIAAEAEDGDHKLPVLTLQSLYSICMMWALLWV
jgi:hypothetical protein